MKKETEFLADLCKVTGLSLWLPFGVVFMKLCLGEAKLSELFTMPLMGASLLGILAISTGYIIIREKFKL